MLSIDKGEDLQLPVKLCEEDRKAIASTVSEALGSLLEGLLQRETAAPIWDVQKVADYLQVSTDWIYKKVSERAIPHTRLGKHLKFRKRDIDLWLEEHSVRPLLRNPADKHLAIMRQSDGDYESPDRPKRPHNHRHLRTTVKQNVKCKTPGKPN